MSQNEPLVVLSPQGLVSINTKDKDGFDNIGPDGIQRSDINEDAEKARKKKKKDQEFIKKMKAVMQ